MLGRRRECDAGCGQVQHSRWLRAVEGHAGERVRRQPRAPPRRPHGLRILPLSHGCNVTEIGTGPDGAGNSFKMHGDAAEFWSDFCKDARSGLLRQHHRQLLWRIRKSTACGVMLSPPCRNFSQVRADEGIHSPAPLRTVKKNTEMCFAELINNKNNNVRMKLQTLQVIQIFLECRIMVGGASVRTSKHSLFRLKITVGCSPCTCPSIRVCDV